MAADSPITVTQIERDILRGLCAGVIDSVSWRRMIDQLTAHSWKDPEHKVVYDALRAIRSQDAQTRRQELPAEVTRMGFPDVDWGKYLDREALPSVPLEELLARLWSWRED
jgi:hypothetical protein